MQIFFLKNRKFFLLVISIWFDVFPFFCSIYCFLFAYHYVNIFFSSGFSAAICTFTAEVTAVFPRCSIFFSAAHEPRRACALRGPPPDKVGVNQFSLLQCRPFGRTALRLGSVFFLLAEDNNACARNDRCNTNADEAHCAGYRRIGSVGGNCGGFIGDAGLIGDDGLAADYD